MLEHAKDIAGRRDLLLPEKLTLFALYQLAYGSVTGTSFFSEPVKRELMGGLLLELILRGKLGLVWRTSIFGHVAHIDLSNDASDSLDDELLDRGSQWVHQYLGVRGRRVQRLYDVIRDADIFLDTHSHDASVLPTWKLILNRLVERGLCTEERVQQNPLSTLHSGLRYRTTNDLALQMQRRLKMDIAAGDCVDEQEAFLMYLAVPNHPATTLGTLLPLDFGAHGLRYKAELIARSNEHRVAFSVARVTEVAALQSTVQILPHF